MQIKESKNLEMRNNSLKTLGLVLLFLNSGYSQSLVDSKVQPKIYKAILKGYYQKNIVEIKDCYEDDLRNRMFDFILDTNEFYSIKFNKLRDTLGIFKEKNWELISYKGFSKKYQRLSCAQTIENYGIPYLINAGKPFTNYKREMDAGVVAYNKESMQVIFVSGFLNLASLKSAPFDLLKIRNNLKYFIEIRYFNYYPTNIRSIGDNSYSFYSNKTHKEYILYIDFSSGDETLHLW
jgi:hypothetical protein